ncbi:choice-of-anchor L domain-containing protein, partial [Aurantibacter aestuarii]
MKQSLLFILFTLIFSLAPAQDIAMQNGIFNQCSGVFSDSGGVGTGAGFNYGNNEDFTVTICPDTAGTFVALDFTAFSTQATVDVLTIYDGDDNTAPVLGTYSGGPANSPGFIFASPTSATGCLTISFVSNATGVTTGWAADISCLQSCQVIDATIDSTNPVANGTGVIEIPIGTNVQFNGSATFSDDPSTAVYQWDFGEGAPANTASANHTYNTTGTYTVTFTASDTNPTGCSDTETITVRVLENIILINDALDPESTYNIDQLVEDVLVSGGCSAVSNFTFNVAGAPADRTTKSYGYFKRGGAAGFPFAEGIMLSSGRAFPGGNTINGALVSTNNGIGGDADLEAALGQTNTNDATFVKFEFVPTQDNISFNYVMVSEEYDGNFECTFADSFAFLLRPVGTVPYQNLAVLPNGTPVSVTSINNAPGCASNPGLFAGYDVPGTNYGGQTVVLTATANVVAGQAYEIKLVMADQGDSIYDSAVFLEAGSFSLGGDLGDDVTIASGTAQCQGTTVVLDTGVDSTVIHQWSDGNGVIAGETGPTLDVTVAGTYSVEVQFAPGCVSNDSVVVEFIDGAVIDNLLDLTECDNGVDAVEFDLTVNTSEALGTQDPTFYQVSYYNSLADADVPQNPITNLTNYPGTNGEIIYVRADDTSSGACYSTSSFILTITSPDINPVPDLTECDVLPNDGFAMFDLEVQTPTILGAQPAADFTVTYYASLAEANAGTPNIVSPYQNIGSPQPIYVRIQSNTDPLCYTVSQTPVFDLIVTPQQDSSFTMTPTCDGATAVITGDAGGVFAFNPVPTDGAVIDAATGTVTGGTQSTTYTVEYTTSGPCPSTSTESFTVLSSNDTTFTLAPTCDGATATVTGDAGGTFTFNPVPTDGAVIDATTGTITNGTQGSTYTVEYSFTLPCPVSSTQSVTVFPLEDASFTTTPTCDGATVTVTGDAGGVFAFNPDPMDGSVIDPVTGTVTGGPPSATYTIEYTTTGPCPVQNTENVTVFAEETSAFTVTATCDGGTATVTGDAGGSFAFNPAPTDGAVIDVATGTVTMGTPGAVYTIEYTTGGPCPDVSTVNLAVLNQDNSSFTLSPTCDGATATITGQAGGTFAFNPVPTDGAMINTTTGTITNAPFDATYTVEYTTNGPCPTTTTQSVTVFSQPTIVPPTPLEVCDDNVPDGFTAIDLTLKNNEVTGNNPAYTVSYHLLQTQAENDTDALPNTYTNISNPQIIYVRVEDSSTGCADTAPLELRVVQAPAANTPMPLEYCDPDADGFGTFDLDSTIPEITGNAAGLTVTFHETQTNAENGVVELSSPYDNIMINTQTIYVRIESATVATDCASFVQLQLIVYPTPQILDTPTTIEICDNAT